MAAGNRYNGASGVPQPQIHTPFLLQAQQWINELVEYEIPHSRPVPLTKAQKKLLAELEQTLEPPALAEPALDGNWVGTLLGKIPCSSTYLLYSIQQQVFDSVRWKTRD